MGHRRRDRYELRIARINGRALAHDPGPRTEMLDLDDDEEFQEICGLHFVPMACAAEGVPVYDRLQDMPFLDDYQLEVWHRNKPRKPVATSRSTHGREMAGIRFR